MRKETVPPIPPIREKPKAKTETAQQGPPARFSIGSALFDRMRRFRRRRSSTTYLQMHRYEVPPYDSTEDKTLVYISGNRRSIYNFTGAEEGIERIFENKPPNEVYESFKRALDTTNIPYTDHGLQNRVYICSFPDGRISDLIAVIHTI